jgi:hypothetical protein
MIGQVHLVDEPPMNSEDVLERGVASFPVVVSEKSLQRIDGAIEEMPEPAVHVLQLLLLEVLIDPLNLWRADDPMDRLGGHTERSGDPFGGPTQD